MQAPVRRVRAGIAVAVLAAVAACGTEAPTATEEAPGATGPTVPDTAPPLDTTVPPRVGPLPVGATADLGAVRVTVVRAEAADQANRGLARGRFLLAAVRLEAGDEPVAFGPRDWVLDTPGGVIRPFALAEDDRLEFGRLTDGAVVEGRVGFDLGGTDGPARLRYTSPVGEAWWSVDLSGAVSPAGKAPPVSSPR
jgi:hypothetical protein